MGTYMANKKTIFVGVSGGVDSSVAAAVLKDQGHHVVGVFIRTWQPEWMECTWRDERRDAMRVCAHLGIPFLECDLTQEYKTGVADYMISEYRAGRTPNPDVMCNKEVKFGGFLKWARERGADYVATGHYARTDNQNLLRGIDDSKDQSYFLWTLTPDQLQHTLFPIGDMPKSQTRKLAQKYSLPTATKKDSQGICFIGKVSMKEFLSHYIDEQPGDVLDNNGEIIGNHPGALFFTLGERHGFTITQKGTDDQAMYVIGKDIEQNTITVAPKDFLNTSDSEHRIFKLHSVNDITNAFAKGFSCEAQIRYHGEIKNITFLSYNPEEKEATIQFAKSDATITAGQSVVLYDGEMCLGGGIVV